jgi:hypothetical protein
VINTLLHRWRSPGTAATALFAFRNSFARQEYT